MIPAADLEHRLPPPAQAWLESARQHPLAEVFPAVARAVGRQPTAAPSEHWTVDQAVRALLLVGVGVAEVLAVYRYGDANEKHAVLRALGIAEVAAGLGHQALPIVEDAIRTNDQRLVAAALGPYATKWLPQAAFRQAVLKCVFAGIPLAVVDGVPERVDGELIRMMNDFAAERTAAGRVIPEDLEPYLSSPVSPS
jgi:hypothetical protein